LAPQVTKGLRSKSPIDMQQNVALWLIDNLAIRAGNEKDTSEEADTVSRPWPTRLQTAETGPMSACEPVNRQREGPRGGGRHVKIDESVGFTDATRGRQARIKLIS
jgi:hypothetical protein